MSAFGGKADTTIALRNVRLALTRVNDLSCDLDQAVSRRYACLPLHIQDRVMSPTIVNSMDLDKVEAFRKSLKNGPVAWARGHRHLGGAFGAQHRSHRTLQIG
jgi:hypothetical protein